MNVGKIIIRRISNIFASYFSNWIASRSANVEGPHFVYRWSRKLPLCHLARCFLYANNVNEIRFWYVR